MTTEDAVIRLMSIDYCPRGNKDLCTNCAICERTKCFEIIRGDLKTLNTIAKCVPLDESELIEKDGKYYFYGKEENIVSHNNQKEDENIPKMEETAGRTCN